VTASPPRQRAVAFSVAALAAGVLAGAVLPSDSGPGIAIPLVALAVAGAVAILALPALGAHGVVFGSLSLVLTCVAALRAADWVVILDLLFAVALSSYALAGGKTWWETIRGLFLAGGRLHRAPGFLFKPLVREAREGRADLGPLVRGVLVSGVLLFVFGALFAGADTAFAQIAGNVVDGALPNVGSLPGRFFAAAVISLFATSLVLVMPRYSSATDGWLGRLHAADWSRPRAAAAEKPQRSSSRVEWLIPLVALDLLFAAFVAIQLTVLFGGRDHVLRTSGLTYAEYARSGFFQLVAVAALVLIVIAVMTAWTRKADERDRRIVKILLGCLCFLTLVVLASALRRIGLYEDALGFTRLRLFVHGTIFWLGAIFALIITGGIVRGAWLPRAAMVTTAVALLIFTAIDPDAMIAERNVTRFETTGRIDISYLATLSADAVPALMELPADRRACALGMLRLELARSDPWFGWNLGRETARDLLARTDPGSSVGCVISDY
jgi:hypothetical protein